MNVKIKKINKSVSMLKKTKIKEYHDKNKKEKERKKREGIPLVYISYHPSNKTGTETSRSVKIVVQNITRYVKLDIRSSTVNIHIRSTLFVSTHV